jgi:6-pyruvoyl-tetrahydropterin synthase
MYTLGVKRDFIARHYLIGGDWGPENNPNSHHYVLELQLEGSELDQHGYLTDIVEVDRAAGRDRELLSGADVERQARVCRLESIHRALRPHPGCIFE